MVGLSGHTHIPVFALNIPAVSSWAETLRAHGTLPGLTPCWIGGGVSYHHNRFWSWLSPQKSWATGRLYLGLKLLELKGEKREQFTVDEEMETPNQRAIQLYFSHLHYVVDLHKSSPRFPRSLQTAKVFCHVRASGTLYEICKKCRERGSNIKLPLFSVVQVK